ncbi:MAG: GNAT family N-acetyltransferase [Oscillospiraceae bacterium]|nr:GNAT family N-acetyltransferase [Oscillospiraceae bacterium]
MGNTIYIDQNTMENAIGLILGRDTTAVYTGLEVRTETGHPVLAELSRLCGLDFFPQGAAPEVPLYAVPYLEVFASDGQGGWFAAHAGRDSPIYYIAPDRSPHLAAEHRNAFFHLAVTDPDWRRKILPGNWPRLPEDPEARKKLAETLSVPPEKEASILDALPRVFPSRAEAEKEFPILDIWMVLRDNKSPRFQVHPMMSPQDREGRAQVHYQAWQETYHGLVPENVLAAHTLEHCRKAANDRRSSSTNTFVALDREDGDRVVGFGTLSYHARDFVSVPEAGEVVALYVLQDFQGHGIGRDLLEHCLARLPRPRVALFVLKGNDKAIGFYEHMGFRLTGHEITQDGMTELEMVLEKA